jgi:NADH-quinone oxidoreductase subunit M
MIGFLYERTHTRDLSAYGGLAGVTPAMAATFLIVTLSSIGLPGTNGFVGEFLVLIGTFTSKVVRGAIPLAVVGATGVILGAVYMLWMYQRVFFGPPRKAAAHGLADLTVREWFTIAPLLLAIVGIGFVPQPLLATMKDPVDAVVQRVSRADRPVRKAELGR